MGCRPAQITLRKEEGGKEKSKREPGVRERRSEQGSPGFIDPLIPSFCCPLISTLQSYLYGLELFLVTQWFCGMSLSQEKAPFHFTCHQCHQDGAKNHQEGMFQHPCSTAPQREKPQPLGAPSARGGRASPQGGTRAMATLWTWARTCSWREWQAPCLFRHQPHTHSGTHSRIAMATRRH